MILSCPACHARFSVPDHLVPPEGREVRCGKCRHTWHVDKPAPVSDASLAEASARVVEALSAAPSPTPSTVTQAVPEVLAPDLSTAFDPPPPPPKPRSFSRRMGDKKPVLKAKPFKIAVPVLSVLWLIMAFITYSPQWSQAPGLSAIYQLMGATPTEGLAFADVTMTREQASGKTKFILAGNIRNSASSTRLVPTVRVQLKDKENQIIWGREYPVNTVLKAGETYPFRISNVETAFAKNVAQVVVDMGNSVQLLVR